MEETEEVKEKKKTQSRKFIVWVVWLLITLCIIVFGMVIKPEISDSMKSLVEKVLDYFENISMLYLGANVLQKLGFAASEALKEKKDV